ncbi:MAG: hypothetical protein N2167_04850 [Flavobacteriales bacterium]|nr:hypothetical protein [Flavobacteriales bacterium]
MKKFDTDEKYIISEIVTRWKNGQAVCLADIVDRFLLDIDVKLDYQNRTVELLFDQQKFLHLTNFTTIVTDKAWLLMRFVTLLKYLQGLDYIYLYQQGNVPKQPTRFGLLLKGNTPVSYQITDPIIVDFLLDYSYRTIVVGQILIDYVENDFKTDEQIRHDENIKIAKDNLDVANNSLVQAKKSVNRSSVAIGISILLGILSIAVSIFLSQRPIDAKINKTQYETLTKSLISIDSLYKKTNDFLEQNILPDTVKTIVTKPVRLVK